VIKGVTGTISKSLRQYLSTITEKHEIKKLQKTAILDMHTSVESANVKVQSRFHRQNNITSSTNCTYRTAAKLCTLETWFVSGV
jgi:hypothetical protein